MRDAFWIILSTSLVIYSGSEAAAKDVQISGTHSVSNIETHCIDNGGTFFNGPGGGYGCAGSGGGTVTCNAKGKCTGTVSGSSKPSGSGIAGVIKAHPISVQAQTIQRPPTGNVNTTKSGSESKHK